MIIHKIIIHRIWQKSQRKALLPNQIKEMQTYNIVSVGELFDRFRIFRRKKIVAGQNRLTPKSAQKKNEPTLLYLALIKNKIRVRS